MARMSKIEKALNQRVEQAFKKYSSNVPIPIMELSNILNAGRKAGKNGENVEEAIKNAIEKVKT